MEKKSKAINVPSFFLYIFAVFVYSNKKTFVDGAVRVRRGNKSYAQIYIADAPRSIHPVARSFMVVPVLPEAQPHRFVGKPSNLQGQANYYSGTSIVLTAALPAWSIFVKVEKNSLNAKRKYNRSEIKMKLFIIS